MPRRQFIADLQKAQQDVLPRGIHDVQPGEDDGQFEFLFSASTANVPPTVVQVTALVPELSEYPQTHEYMIFSGEDAPSNIADALQNIRKTKGRTVFELLDIVSTTLSRLSPDRDGDTPMPDSQFEDNEGEEEEDDDDDDDVYGSDHEAFQLGSTHTTALAQPSPGVKSRVDRTARARIRADLVKAKKAGFKVGVLGHILDGFNAFVTVSIHMSKLGISEEAMQAWQVEPSEYLILILQYPNGYKTHEELQGFDSIRLDPNIGMRICVGKKYKPSLQEAIKAFTVAKRNGGDCIIGNDLLNGKEVFEESSIKDSFISKSLNGLLKERLVPILRLRSAGMAWNGAEELFRAQTTAAAAKSDVVPDEYFLPEPINDALPDICNADHYAAKATTEFSFPLLAMQFVLRHFVRCTEFCLVCHRKLDGDLEAIKPYVCESELCLYQYMTLGFGPSIEHEVLAQPYVVDLLISICYTSSTYRKLKEYPDGLSLTVAPVDSKSANEDAPYDDYAYYGRHKPETEEKKVEREPVPTFDVGFDHDRLEMIFFTKPKECPVRRGDWIVLNPSGTLQGSELHCRVSDVTFYPTISINEPVIIRMQNNDRDKALNAAVHADDSPAPIKSKADKPATPAPTPKWTPATFQVYCEDFKDLTRKEKCLTICRLLDTLPDVKVMQEYVAKRQSADLRNWVERISPAALSLLRWIIASNRACIMQVDGNNEGHPTPRKEERLYGMPEYMQFRFAMGAPDKEQRFINEARKMAARLNLQYPTLFAWHGSPLFNWHMIIREGLHYKNVDHGRAYGDGVYHALDANTSGGYSGRYYGMGTASNNIQSPGMWPNSVLRISSALALNEIVNAPAEFTSHSPFYVVKQLDWIQTRYLFVQCAPSLEGIKNSTDTKPQNALQQDPSRIPKGNNGEPIIIPASAVKSNRLVKDDRRPDTPKNPNPSKKLKILGSAKAPIPIDDDTDSVATDESDNEVLFGTDPEPEPEPTTVKEIKPTKLKGPATDFVPGSLDFSKLPLMPTPTYATSGTTKRLMKELQTVQKVQEMTPLAELGWFIDAGKIDNVYQWIVELHSFHTFEIKGKKLPLAEDMKKKDIKSVVLEIRFNKDFPYTPPYVRVIRPRFLGFNQGGGGHIVIGGAMCMELLTNTGWSSVSSMESVLMQIRMAIASEPFARLDMHGTGDYGPAEAASGYIRACQTHGWEVPPGFKEMAYGTAELEL